MKGQETLGIGPGAPTFEKQDDSHNGRDGRGGEENAADDFALRAEEEREVEDSPGDEHAAQVDIDSDVALCGVGPLAKDPRGNKEQSEGLLGFIAEQNPASEGGDGPEKYGGGPVLLDIEDLADKRDGCAGGKSADSVEGGRETVKLFTCKGAADVEDGDHKHDDGVTPAGAELIPVCGDEESNTAGEEDPSEDEGDSSLPPQAGGALLLRFIGADAGSGVGVEDAGGLPAI